MQSNPKGFWNILKLVNITKDQNEAFAHIELNVINNYFVNS